MTPDNARLMSIFMPRALKSYARVSAENGPDFVHYTSAANALKILSGPVPLVWMRNARCMNDVSEVFHGLDRIKHTLGQNDRFSRLLAAVKSCSPAVADRIFPLFDGHVPNILGSTYITCVSEHNAATEDQYGRLSMWRAYGQGSIGTAIVLNKEPLFSSTDALNSYSSPVAYLDDEELATDLENIIENISKERHWLASHGDNVLETRLFSMLLFAVTCLKHPGFKEEREWRIIHNPRLFPSKVLLKSTETIAGVPQKIYKIPLQDIPGPTGISGISPEKLIKRVIIGPSNYSATIFDAVVDALEGAGVTDAFKRVHVSDIPLRMLL